MDVSAHREVLLHKRIASLLPVIEAHHHGSRAGESEFLKRLCRERGPVAALALENDGSV